MSMNRNVNTTMAMSMVKMLWKSNWQKIGAIDGGVSIIPWNFVIPIGIPISDVASIPMSNAPGTRLAMSTDVSTMPIDPSNAEP